MKMGGGTQRERYGSTKELQFEAACLTRVPRPRLLHRQTGSGVVPPVRDRFRVWEQMIGSSTGCKGSCASAILLMLQQRGDPVAQDLQFGTQAVQEREILQGLSYHQVSASVRSARVAVTIKERMEDLLLHAWIRTRVCPAATNLFPERGTGVYLYLGVCRGAEQRNVSCPKLCLQSVHRIGAGAVGIWQEQPEIIETVENGKFIPNDRHSVCVTANPWLPWSLYLGERPAGVRHDNLYQGS